MGGIAVGSAGYYALIFVFALCVAAVIFLRSRGAGKPVASEEQYAKMDKELLEQIPDEKLVNAVAANLMSKMVGKRSDPMVALAHLSRGRNAVFFTWMLCKEVEHNGVEALCKKPANKFIDVGVEGLKTIGAVQTAQAVEAFVSGEERSEETQAALLAALQAEQPLTLCIPYIRENAEQFID